MGRRCFAPQAWRTHHYTASRATEGSDLTAVREAAACFGSSSSKTSSAEEAQKELCGSFSWISRFTSTSSS
uniref:Uncharacterized protein n=1 Tax=Anopheles minimus TaxID=112268 RepID=A0A182WGD4_9DIPT